MNKILFFLGFVVISFNTLSKDLPEMVIGEETVSPGINLIFEGAIKDDVSPAYKFGKESTSDIHLEVLSTWNENAPRGSTKGGFVAYLEVSAKILNENNGSYKNIRLLPHINMSDNLHYALNTKLPGKRDDLYTVIFTIKPPKPGDLGMHFDWREEVDSFLIKEHTFIYKNLDFFTIAEASRR